MKRLIGIFLTLFFGTQTAFAQETLLEQERIYLGGGLNDNDLTGYSGATGFQLFAGYDLPVKITGATVSVEVGYWDSGDFDTTVGPIRVETSANGLWANGVFSLHVNRTVDLLGRAGLDFGDDNGLMFGIGVGFKLNRQLQLRGEYVERDTVDSLQLNLVYHM